MKGGPPLASEFEIPGAAQQCSISISQACSYHLPAHSALRVRHATCPQRICAITRTCGVYLSPGDACRRLKFFLAAVRST
ncbi:hypothetical protein MVEN_01645000 [Mycena venus]|uniref:Uncharacterized protein n=1 Tax=Mycena venus TaxID=2733690 RepID=A0A8H6XN69_9AGAR|nr:hypothetical protein MVEN_01645000 [Mycena venus]